MYKSPIDLIYEDMSAYMVDVAKKVDEEIWQAIVRCVPNIDKDELLRALQYDRDQYNKGYADGRRDSMDELVHCQNCEFCKYNSSSETYKCMSLNGMYGTVELDGFCSYGVRKGADNE